MKIFRRTPGLREESRYTMIYYHDPKNRLSSSKCSTLLRRPPICADHLQTLLGSRRLLILASKKKQCNQVEPVLRFVEKSNPALGPALQRGTGGLYHSSQSYITERLSTSLPFVSLPFIFCSFLSTAIFPVSTHCRDAQDEELLPSWSASARSHLCGLFVGFPLFRARIPCHNATPILLPKQ